jgi:DNA-directed RNA polymerase subunit H (RpoH/RPB5)
MSEKAKNKSRKRRRREEEPETAEDEKKRTDSDVFHMTSRSRFQRHLAGRIADNVRKMMVARGFRSLVDQELQALTASWDQADQTQTKPLVFARGAGETVRVEFVREFFKELLTSFAESALVNGINHVIFVCDTVTSLHHAYVNLQWQPAQTALRCELFTKSESFYFALTELGLVAERMPRLLKGEEKAKFLKAHAGKESRLPGIDVAEPVSRFFGAAVGDVIEFMRRDARVAFYRYPRIVRQT